MNSKNLILVAGFVVTLLFLFFGYTSITSLFNSYNSTDNTTLSPPSDTHSEVRIQPVEITKDNFILGARYISNNTWEYDVSGFLPNPCYSASVEVFIDESFPEQVNINLQIIQPDSDLICTQVIENYVSNGIFQASSEASIEFNITR